MRSRTVTSLISYTASKNVSKNAAAVRSETFHEKSIHKPKCVCVRRTKQTRHACVIKRSADKRGNARVVNLRPIRVKRRRICRTRQFMHKVSVNPSRISFGERVNRVYDARHIQAVKSGHAVTFLTAVEIKKVAGCGAARVRIWNAAEKSAGAYDFRSAFCVKRPRVFAQRLVVPAILARV